MPQQVWAEAAAPPPPSCHIIIPGGGGYVVPCIDVELILLSGVVDVVSVAGAGGSNDGGLDGGLAANLIHYNSDRHTSLLVLRGAGPEFH